MKTELETVAEQLGLSYDKQVKVMWGNYMSYKIAIQEDLRRMRYSYHITLKSTSATQTGNPYDFVQFLLNDKQLIKAASYEGYSLRIEVQMSRMAKNNFDNIILVLNRVIEFARNNEYASCCEICGNPTDVFIYTVNGKVLCRCSECYNKTISDLNQMEELSKKKKGSYLTGLVGAFIASLIGVALWVAVYALGYIAAICGIILAICIIKGFELFGGKLNLPGILTTVIITLIMVYVATYISYGYTIYDTFKDIDNIDIFSAIRSTGSFIREYPEVSSSFYKDLGLGYLYTVIGSVSTFISVYRANRTKITSKKLLG